MDGKIRGRVVRLGDHVNTDLLLPSSYFSLDDETLREGLFSLAGDLRERDADAPSGADATGRIIVAGRNFGCGSSRETTVRAMVLRGVSAIVAVSFGRIFYRNATNLGIPALECPGAHEYFQDGGEIEADPYVAVVRCPVKGKIFPCSPVDPHILAVLAHGGLEGYMKARGEI